MTRMHACSYSNGLCLRFSSEERKPDWISVCKEISHLLSSAKMEKTDFTFSMCQFYDSSVTQVQRVGIWLHDTILVSFIYLFSPIQFLNVMHQYKRNDQFVTFVAFMTYLTIMNHVFWHIDHYLLIRLRIPWLTMFNNLIILSWLFDVKPWIICIRGVTRKSRKCLLNSFDIGLLLIFIS